MFVLFIGPLKRVKKLYLADPTLPVPKRAFCYWKANGSHENNFAENIESTVVENTNQSVNKDATDKPSHSPGINVDVIPVTLPDNTDDNTLDQPTDIAQSNVNVDEGVSTLKLASINNQDLVFKCCDVTSNHSDLESDEDNLSFLSSSSSGSESEQSCSSESDDEKQYEQNLMHENSFTELQLQSLYMLSFIFN